MAILNTCFLVTVINKDEVTQRIVDAKSFTLGRSLEATITLSTPNVSRIHVQIVSKNDQMWIEDQGSSNGTFINEEAIPPKKMVPLTAIDRVRLGKEELYINVILYEKVFDTEKIKKANISENDRQSIMETIKSAHMEANRILNLAQEHQQNIIKVGEEKIEEELKNSKVECERILQEAREQALHIIQQAAQGSASLQELEQPTSMQNHSKKSYKWLGYGITVCILSFVATMEFMERNSEEPLTQSSLSTELESQQTEVVEVEEFSLEEMKKLEELRKSQISELLGTEAKYQAFKRLEKKFQEDESKNRTPASN